MKTQSNRLSSASSIYSPQQQEEIRKAKLTKEKQSKLEAERALRSGATYTKVGLHDLLGNGMYGRLMNEHRRKVREAQKQLHEWKGGHRGKQGGNNDKSSSDGENKLKNDEKESDVDDIEEDTVISNAVEMLPDHVVKELKEKYETDSIVEALSKALQEEESGELSKAMTSPSKEEPTQEEQEKVVDEGEKEVQPEEAKEDQQKDEKQQGDTEEEKPIQEVREKIENMSINDAKVDESADPIAPATPEQSKPTISEETIDSIEKTKLFYNKHADELIAKIDQDADALTPTALRDSFLSYLYEEAHSVTKKANATPSSTIIDLGCGHGRDTLHFSSLGHHVLAVDNSYAMLHHAKTIAPNAHFLNMDMRMLKNLLVDQSVDGIWCHASLSHLPKSDLESLMRGLYVTIKVGGVLYFSLNIGSHDQMGEAGEVLESDERFTSVDNGDDSCQFNSYYTSSEVVELLSKTGWDVIKIGEYDPRDKSDYPTHSLLYVFGTRRKD